MVVALEFAVAVELIFLSPIGSSSAFLPLSAFTSFLGFSFGFSFGFGFGFLLVFWLFLRFFFFSGSGFSLDPRRLPVFQVLVLPVEVQVPAQELFFYSHSLNHFHRNHCRYFTCSIILRLHLAYASSSNAPTMAP